MEEKPLVKKNSGYSESIAELFQDLALKFSPALVASHKSVVSKFKELIIIRVIVENNKTHENEFLSF